MDLSVDLFFFLEIVCSTFKTSSWWTNIRRSKIQRWSQFWFVEKNLISYLYSDSFLIKELSAEQKEMQQLARKFTKEEIIPNAAHYDKTGEVKRNEILERKTEKIRRKKLVLKG